jgi:uncharacterized membrane protein YgcG
MMKKVLALILFCLMATTAHAGEPWPANVCETLAKYEQKDIGYAQGDPVKLAFGRSNVLRMLRNHCGIDIRAKEAADLAAVRAGYSGYSDGGGGGDSGGGGGVGFVQPIEIDPNPKKPSMHCTTMALGGGMSATDCE